jgi:L-alanine-DL-glutamate epimerase-like enolase superfamily enzyme
LRRHRPWSRVDAATIAAATASAVCDAVINGCDAVGPLKMAADVVTEPVSLDRREITLGDGPGSGVAIDAAALARVRQA